MIDRIIEFSAANKFLVFILVGFAVVGGIYSMRTVPLDAIPDLSDTQVIVYSRWDRSPDIMEDQVTYPIVTTMLGAPKVKDVRGFSDFGYSFVYIIFEEGTDIYWARSRTLEYLSSVLPRLPQGVKTELGPDATGVGWVFQYALVDTTGKRSLAELRSLQDWFLNYQFKSVPGVAEVAPIGGFVRQYQVNVDPNRLQAYNIPIMRVVEAVRKGNDDVGGRLIEMAGAEYMVRGRGYAKSEEDIGKIALGASENGVPIRVSDVGTVTLGPDMRRGVADYNGTGDVVSGIIVMRQGENALNVIERVKAKIKEVEPGLPAGLKIVSTYDRSDLILRSVENLKGTLTEEMIIVSLVILVFLWHVPSAIIPVFTIPIAIIISFIPMKMMGLTSNIMSLGGIAIAIGAMVDAAIVVVEQTHKKLEEWERTGRKEDYHRVVVNAVKEVGGPSFFALLVIAVSFLPVLTLEAQEGRLFKPLAYTKNFSMIVAAVLAITLDPAMRLLFTHMQKFQFRPAWLARVANAVLVGTIHSEEHHPISRILIRIYDPVCRWALRWKYAVIAAAVAMVLVTIPVFEKLGSEFMPPLNEGSLLYMPSTLPGISVNDAQRLMQVQDRIIKKFPEVESVMGKAGRAETSTDPAPLSMMETVIVLKPETEWRKVSTWYSDWAPEWSKGVFRRLTPDHITQDQLVEEMNAALKLPGASNAWTMPIKGRIDMLTTGVRTPVGIKIYGSDLRQIERLGGEVEALLPRIEGTRNVFAERTGGGYFLDFDWKRDELARYGLTIADAQDVLMSAIGGENVTTTIEGRERYPVNVRYFRDFRSDVNMLGRVLVPTMDAKKQVPISELASIKTVTGPGMLRDENGLLNGYVYVDVAGRDVGSYVEEAKKLVRDNIKLPPGYTIAWSGQYEAMQRVKERLTVILPVTLFLVLMLLYLNTKSLTKTLIIILAVPFSAVGAIWFLYALGYNMSIGVWVGLIALMGVDAETAVFMLLYLDLAYEKAKKDGRMSTLGELQDAIHDGAVKRIRPKFMTVACMFLGLVPIMWSAGAGGDVMKRIAAPMIGGIFTSFLLELVVYPAIYEVWKWNSEVKKQSHAQA
ncbi:efflux RND transporter permease subunit [Paludibaculum fermentans]|uniref:Efflux RND transporter permease subunit n=1 Tax=Paludibaculum fermentans TaxID=1473598 RepID=A0A7S7NQ51_PALFE|nr:CusA/CzcA family heavy metal efflux RND transporter [Paludibaculum fermentans]QOY87649.1 efflux RND transporter permease subunit [Paludibaculum fermentans]